MKDNFNHRKWFKNQYLGESTEDTIKERMLSPDQIERFEGTANMRDLKTLQDMLRMVGSEWMQDGFDKEDIKEYINHYIDQI
jgi:hypothetical protein